ncbi:MAG: pilin [Candidatus Saccharimonadales bacterium]
MKKLLLKISLISALLFPVMAPVVTQAASPSSDVCSAIGSGADCKTSNGPSLTNVVRTVINVLSTIIGVVAVIMIIVAGLRYVTSGGDSNGVSGAKNTLIYAIVGLVIVAMAQFIVQFVLQKTSNTPTCPPGKVLNVDNVCAPIKK